MSYSQYSIYAYTGNTESIKNRIPNNAYDAPSAEYIGFPSKFDVFVNKDNATQGGFPVTETHTLSSLVGDTLYLDHRPDQDSAFSSSDGTLDTATLNLSTASIEFSTRPTAEVFSITYTARGDKIWDSHINVLQNAVMAMQTSLGLLSASGGVGTGIVTLPVVTQYDPSDQTELTSVKTNVLPNIVMLGNLEGDIKIGSTSNASLASYGDSGHDIVLGNRVAGTAPRDNLYIDAKTLAVNDVATGVSTLTYSSFTGDLVGFSGNTTFASQVTIGGPNPGSGVYSGNVPGGMQSFYDDAMLRVNGAIYFGSDLSGNGAITFNTSTGASLDVIGTINADDLIVDNTSTFLYENVTFSFTFIARLKRFFFFLFIIIYSLLVKN